MRLPLLPVVLLLTLSTTAQRDITWESYADAYMGPSKWTVGFTGNRSLADGEPVRFFGIYAGKDYDDLLRLALGIQFLSPDLYEQEILPRGTVTDTIWRTTNMAYWFFRTELTYYRTPKWKLTAPVSIGLGSMKQTERISNRITPRIQENLTVPLDVGTEGIYFVNPWFGLKAGLGLRLAFGKESFSTFSAPYYKLGFGLYPMELYKFIKEE